MVQWLTRPTSSKSAGFDSRVFLTNVKEVKDNGLTNQPRKRSKTCQEIPKRAALTYSGCHSSFRLPSVRAPPGPIISPLNSELPEIFGNPNY
jgi:hypothetical protein